MEVGKPLKVLPLLLLLPEEPGYPLWLVLAVLDAVQALEKKLHVGCLDSEQT